MATGLAFSRDRRQRWRQVSVGLASALAAIALLCAAGVVSAAVSADTRHRARAMVYSEAPNAPIAWAVTAPTLHGQQFPIIWLEAVPGTPPPPGLRSYPRPGTAVLSPGLAGAGVTATDLGLAPSAAGTGPGGLIGDEGLRTRSEPIAYAAYPPGRSLRSTAAQRADGFGVRTTGMASYVDPFVPIPSPADMGWMVAWGILAPAAFLLGGAARTSSQLRARRARILHQLGISRAVVRLVLFLESAILALAGAVPAAGLWLVAAPHVQEAPLTRTTVLPDSFAVPMTVVAGVVLAMTAFAGFVGCALRLTPRRPARRVRTPAGWQIIPFVVSLMVMGASSRSFGSPSMRVPMLFGGALLCLAGIPMALPWLARHMGRRLSGSSSPPRWLAGQRLEYRATHLCRPAAVTAALVFLSGIAVAMEARVTESRPAGATAATAPGFTLDWSAPRAGDAVAVASAFPTSAVFAVGENGLSARSCGDARRAAEILGYTGPSCSGTHMPRAMADVLGRAAGGQVRIAPQDWDRASGVVIVERSQRSELAVLRALGGRVPQPDVYATTGQASSSGTTGGWLVAMWATASLLLLVALTRDIADRIVVSIREDATPGRLGMPEEVMRSVQRWSLIPPVVIAAPLGIVSAIAFALVGAQVGVTAAHLTLVSFVGGIATAVSLAGAFGALVLGRRA